MSDAGARSQVNFASKDLLRGKQNGVNLLKKDPKPDGRFLDTQGGETSI